MFIGPRRALLAAEREFRFDFTGGFLPKGAMLARADATTCATRVNASGLIETVPANVPRFTYDPVTLALQGLLVEPERTNLVINSEAFTLWSENHGTGTGVAAAVTVNDLPSPDGNATADKVVFDTGSGTTAGDLSLLNSASFAGTSGLVYVGRIFCKGTPGNQVQIRHVAGTHYVRTLSGNWNGVWDELTLTETCPVTASRVMTPGLRQEVNGPINSTITCWLWGAHIEQAADLSSYIPTGGSQVTRAADVLTLVVPNGTYTAVIERLSGLTKLLGQIVTSGAYFVPTDVSPVRRISLRRLA